MMITAYPPSLETNILYQKCIFLRSYFHRHKVILVVSVALLAFVIRVSVCEGKKKCVFVCLHCAGVNICVGGY